MNTTEYVTYKIRKLSKGYVFTVGDFDTGVSNREATIKALNRLVTDGVISKLSKGKFYKPETTPFGDLEPDEYQVSKDLLIKNGRIIGYLTGFGIYNKLGLTTQISFVIQIGKKEPRPSIKRGRYKISFIKQKNTITKKNIPLLQILDAIRYIKKIPDTETSFLTKRFLQIIESLNKEDLLLLVRLSLKYPPATRALLGAFIQELNINDGIDILKESLNPLSEYNLYISNKYLKSGDNWNIK